MKKILITAAIALLVSACVSYPKLAEEADTAMAQAEKEIKAAEKMQFLWRDTASMLKSAKQARAEAQKAYDAGDSAKAKDLALEAKKLAMAARKQALLAQEQAKANAGAAPHYPN